ncbi:MAG: helix-turn-helix domain-containing protein [bacterium]|nr:helix-turn-helix domain-containing protein [bacterium]
MTKTLTTRNVSLTVSEGRKRVLASPYFWLEDFRLRLVKLITNDPDALNRKELADQLGVSKAAVSTFLNGDGDFKISTYLKMVAATGYSPVLLFIRTAELAEAEIEGTDVFSTNVLARSQARFLFRPTNESVFFFKKKENGTAVTFTGLVPEEIEEQLRIQGVESLNVDLSALPDHSKAYRLPSEFEILN